MIKHVKQMLNMGLINIININLSMDISEHDETVVYILVTL